jgi:hypothetical protein
MWTSESKRHKISPDPNQDVNNESAADVQNIVDIGNKIPMFVSIKVYPGLRNHIQVTKDIQEVRFRVIDNAGTGNCFYEAILATNVFRRKFPKYKDDHIIICCVPNYKSTQFVIQDWLVSSINYMLLRRKK